MRRWCLLQKRRKRSDGGAHACTSFVVGCGSGVSSLSGTTTLAAAVLASAVEGIQRSVGYGNAGGCGSVGGGSGVNSWFATAMVSAAVALGEAFASVV